MKSGVVAVDWGGQSAIIIRQDIFGANTTVDLLDSVWLFRCEK
jgi:hypothetical protein